MVAVTQDKPVGATWQKRSAAAKVLGYVRTAHGQDINVGWAVEEGSIAALAERAARKMVAGNHVAAFVMAAGLDPVLPGQGAGPQIRLGEGGHWERVLAAAKEVGGGAPASVRRLSKRENAERWLVEQRSAQDRARCIEDSTLLVLRAHAGKWVAEDELFRIPNATCPEIMAALRTLRDYGLVESHGMLWRPVL